MELDKIVSVIKKHHLMTLATVSRGGAEGPVEIGLATVRSDNPSVPTTRPPDNSSACLDNPPCSSQPAVRPWVAHVFYAWVPGLDSFVFTSDPATRHGTEMIAHPHVAGGIALETRIVGRVQGIQIEGSVRRPAETERDSARKAYLKRFPYAAAAGELSLWLLEPSSMKLTDNTLGFGTKLIWTR